MRSSVKCKKRDCFGNEKGTCKVLREGFKYECPFYKTVEEYNRGVLKYGGVMTKYGGDAPKW